MNAIKICGLTSPGAVMAAADAGATHGGFVFFAKSPRNLAHDQARALAAITPPSLKRVILVVDADDAAIAAAVDAVNPGFIQLHGRETPARVADIRKRFGLPVIKVAGVAGPDDITTFLRDHEANADWLMFDAKPPKGSDRPGGLGESFDWRLLSGLKIAKPWFLAGGLSPANVADAIAQSGAHAVDASTSLESAPGQKDETLIAGFVASARRAFEARA